MPPTPKTTSAATAAPRSDAPHRVRRREGWRGREARSQRSAKASDVSPAACYPFHGVSLRRRLRRHVLVSACALAVGLPTACEVSERPPQDGALSIDAGVDSGRQSFQATKPTELSCNLGPDGGVCACADQPLLGDPPNLYFVLDRSASMQQDSKWLTIITVLGSLVVALGPRANVGAAVFPDPHYDNCAPGVEVAPLRRGDAPAGKAGPTATTLLKDPRGPHGQRRDAHGGDARGPRPGTREAARQDVRHPRHRRRPELQRVGRLRRRQLRAQHRERRLCLHARRADQLLRRQPATDRA